MRFAWFNPAAARRTVLLGLAAIALVMLISAGAMAQTAPAAGQQPAQPQAAQQAQPQKPAITFEGDAGLIFVYIKPDKTADFEGLVSHLKEGLAKMEAPEIKQAAASLRLFKVSNTAPGAANAVYAFLADPPVKGGEYWFLSLLYKAFPTETKANFDKWNEVKGTLQPQPFDLTLVTKMQ